MTYAKTIQLIWGQKKLYPQNKKCWSPQPCSYCCVSRCSSSRKRTLFLKPCETERKKIDNCKKILKPSSQRNLQLHPLTLVCQRTDWTKNSATRESEFVVIKELKWNGIRKDVLSRKRLQITRKIIKGQKIQVVNVMSIVPIHVSQLARMIHNAFGKTLHVIAIWLDSPVSRCLSALLHNAHNERLTP